jgi:hypothetical protein
MKTNELTVAERETVKAGLDHPAAHAAKNADDSQPRSLSAGTAREAPREADKAGSQDNTSERAHDFLWALQIAEEAYGNWAAKPHNRKWAKRIYGTPIPNDLRVVIAEAFVKALAGES